MKNIVLSLFLASLIAYPVFCCAFEGPLNVKNQFPLFLPVNQPYLESAAPESSFGVGLSHSSVFVVRDGAGWAAHVDLELTELDFRLRKNFPGIVEVGIDVPVLRATAGFLDGSLAWYHDTFGFPDYGRNTRPRNSFLYDIRRNGAPVIEGVNNRAGFGDTKFKIKKRLLAGNTSVSLLADVEFPTGNARVGYGNGSTDVGAAVLADADLGRSAKLYGNIGMVVPGDLKAIQTVELRTFYYAGAGLEVAATRSINLIVQYLAQTSPYPRTGIHQIDETGMLLVMGGRYYGKSGSYEMSLTEDPNTTGAPDFILNISYKMKF